MTIDDKIRDEKLQYDINREAAKISTLSSRKIDKSEYLTGEEILSFHQRQIIALRLHFIIIVSYVCYLIIYFCFRASQYWVITNDLRY